ncbi:MAG: hypothetical protein HY973_02175 [Candidatus Kerfeldbacteria bacterium]|nr:hypothetical protein [Candidatus Kerfeldbacteria bacterium]
MLKENSNQTETKADRHQRLIQQGTAELSKINIDPNEYERYFDLMRQADAPVGQAIQVLDRLDGVIITPGEALEAWNGIKSIFDKINANEYDETSGQNILNEMKQCTAECVNWLKELTLVTSGKELTEPLKIPDSIKELRNRIFNLKIKFGELPAYLSYRKVGIYKIDESTIPEDEWFRERGNKQSE